MRALVVVAVVAAVCAAGCRVEHVSPGEEARQELAGTVVVQRTGSGFLLVNGTERPDRVNVNRAPAEDFVAVLGLSQADAGRIVAYRKTHGPFETFESLLKVPEIDVEKIKTQRNAIGL